MRALAVTVYFGSAALLWAVDSPHLAAVMVHLNVLESVLALKIKALNDSVSKAVQQLQSVQLQFALLVRLPPHALHPLVVSCMVRSTVLPGTQSL